MNISPRYADRMVNVKPSAIRQLLLLGADPEVISFGGGYPDSSLFPLEQLTHVYQTAIQHGRDSLQYTVSNGTPKLREQVARRLSRDGTECTAENVLILQGGQQGLDLVAKMFINKGDLIITESPTFLGALIAFNPYEPRYLSVPMDAEGMDVDSLEKLLKKTSEVKFVYTIPDFQNPTGVTLSKERRKRLVELSEQYDFYILEDSPYREIRYEGEHISTIKSMDLYGRVIHLGSFSKILAPGLRLGWAIASEEIIGKLGLLKLAADTQCSTLNMTAVSLYIDTYDIEKHITSIKERYLSKKNLMISAIQNHFPSEVSYTNPSGGMFTWLSFPKWFDAGKFMAEELLPKAKVAYVPGQSFFATDEESNHARVSFSTQTEESIVKGITLMGLLLKSKFHNS